MGSFCSVHVLYDLGGVCGIKKQIVFFVGDFLGQVLACPINIRV